VEISGQGEGGESGQNGRPNFFMGSAISATRLKFFRFESISALSTKYFPREIPQLLNLQ
jgi:hypothetical protein